MRTKTLLILLALLCPCTAFSGELGQKVFRKYIEYKRNSDMRRGAKLSEKIRGDRNLYVEMGEDDKRVLLNYWGQKGSEDASWGLMLALGDPDHQVVQRAAHLLSLKCAWGDEGMVMNMVEQKKPPFASLVHALGECKKRRAVPVLIRFAQDYQFGGAAPAATALGKIGDASAIPVLKEAVKKGDVSLKGEAALALARLGESELSKRTAKELLSMSNEGLNSDDRLHLGHARYAASHVYEYAGDTQDLGFLKELSSKDSLGTESKMAIGKSIANIHEKANLPLLGWDTENNIKLNVIYSLPRDRSCWLGKEKEFPAKVHQLETITGAQYMAVFKKYANDPEKKVSVYFIAESRYFMPQKDCITLLNDLIATSRDEYILNLARGRLQQAQECKIMDY